MTDYMVGSISVVITAEYHDPSSFTNDYLVSKGIVPETWQVSHFSSRLVQTEIHYNNGMELTLSPDKLQVLQSFPLPPGPLEERGSVEAHSIATSYLENVPQSPYRELGLNCLLGLQKDDPKRFLSGKFCPWLEPNEDFLVAPNFARLDSGYKTILRLNVGSMKVTEQKNTPVTEQKNTPVVVIDCNCSPESQNLEASEMVDWIHRWVEVRTGILSFLEEILRDG